MPIPSYSNASVLVAYTAASASTSHHALLTAMTGPLRPARIMHCLSPLTSFVVIATFFVALPLPLPSLLPTSTPPNA